MFLDRRRRGPIGSVLLVIIGCLVGWLVGNAVFSETALRIFLIFCIKVKKSQSRIFEKNSWFGDIRKKVSKLAQNQTLIFFTKTALTIFLVFGLKLVLNMTFNLNQTYFSEKMEFGDIWPRNRQKIAQTEVFGHFLDFAS